MDQREQILVIVFSIVGFLSLLFITIFSIWCVVRKRSKKELHQPQKYERSKKISTANAVLNKRKQRKKRLNTNESAISWTFSSPHLINQNVKNLDQFVANESSTPRSNQSHVDLPSPAHTSSSPLSTLVVGLQSDPYNHQCLNGLHFEFLNDLNHILYLNQHEKSSSNILRYSQSCRQTNDCLPFDHSRSMTPSSARQTRFTHLRDDTAILY